MLWGYATMNMIAQRNIRKISRGCRVLKVGISRLNKLLHYKTVDYKSFYDKTDLDFKLHIVISGITYIYEIRSHADIEKLNEAVWVRKFLVNSCSLGYGVTLKNYRVYGDVICFRFKLCTVNNTHIIDLKVEAYTKDVNAQYVIFEMNGEKLNPFDTYLDLITLTCEPVVESIDNRCPANFLSKYKLMNQGLVYGFSNDKFILGGVPLSFWIRRTVPFKDKYIKIDNGRIFLNDAGLPNVCGSDIRYKREEE